MTRRRAGYGSCVPSHHAASAPHRAGTGGPDGAAGTDSPDSPVPPWWPLLSAFAALSQELLAEHDEQALYSLICERVTRVVPAADLCGITVRRRRGRLESAATTDPVAEQADQLQYQLSEGPCVDATRQEEDDCHLAPDLARDPRWPSWGPRAAELGIRSLISVRLPSDTMHERHQPLGALNLYSGTPDAFGADHLALARVYARHAANALAAARQITSLEQATTSRHLIGVAQGVLCQRYDLEPEGAFELLGRLSSEHNLKLRDIAERVIAERGMPDGLGVTADRPPVRGRLDPV
jgi:hypothetical protein